MTTSQNEILRYGHFCGFLEDKMVNLGPVDFQMGWPLSINAIDGQNKFEVHISKIWPKWPIFGPTLSGHNSAIYYPILTFDHTKMISSSRRMEWCYKLSSISFRSATWTQNNPQVVGTCQGHQLQPQPIV